MLITRCSKDHLERFLIRWSIRNLNTWWRMFLKIIIKIINYFLPAMHSSSTSRTRSIWEKIVRKSNSILMKNSKNSLGLCLTIIVKRSWLITQSRFRECGWERIWKRLRTEIWRIPILTTLIKKQSRYITKSSKLHKLTRSFLVCLEHLTELKLLKSWNQLKRN